MIQAPSFLQCVPSQLAWERPFLPGYFLSISASIAFASR